MDAQKPANPFAQHYLEIQALEQAGQSSQPVAAASIHPAQFATLALATFLVFFITGFLILFLKRYRDVKSFMMVAVFALAVSAMPTLMQSLGRPTAVTTKASPDSVPREVVVASVTTSSFVISWTTTNRVAGAMRLGPAATYPQDTQVYRDFQPTTYHRFVVLNLHPGETYAIEILSDFHWYNYAGNPIAVTTAAKAAE